MIYQLVCLILIITNVCAIPDNGSVKVIQTKNGKVQGSKLLTLVEQKEYYSFKGIPFAQPPIGSLRFKAPQKPISWDGTLDAFEYKPKCAQLDFFSNVYGGSENCLYLNVFTPVTSNSEKLPTMLYIYGGGYQSGAAQFFGPDLLLNQNVIVVTFNYRLGPLGFLSLGTKEFSGNMGLKDQKLALQWVSDNIEQFGGDKEQITLFGESAGGASVHFHLMVPESKKLFQRAILQSGVAFNSWSYNIESDHKFGLKEFAKENGDDNIKNLEKYVLNINAEQLSKFTFIPFYQPGSGTKIGKFYWAPIIEQKNAVDPIITDPIEYLLSEHNNSNEIDTLFGYTSAEMLFLMGAEYTNDSLLQAFNEKFEIQLPLQKNLPDFNTKAYTEMTDKVRTFYFGKNGSVNKASFAKYMDLLSDLYFSYGVDKAARLQAKQSSGNTFLYKYSIDTDMDFLKHIAGPIAELPGATHTAELMLLFIVDLLPDMGNFYQTIKIGSKEHERIKFVTKIWTDFAKYGKPHPTVKPIEGDVINYVDITNDGIVLGTAPNKDRVQLWDELSRYEETSTNRKTEL